MSQIAEEKLRKYMEEQKLDGFFISRPVNVKYISSYTGEDSYLLITQKAKYFITDPRYTEQVSIECPDYTIVDWRAEIGSVPGTAAFLANQDHLKNLAFEADHLTVDIYQHIQEKTKAELVPETNVV